MTAVTMMIMMMMTRKGSFCMHGRFSAYHDPSIKTVEARRCDTTHAQHSTHTYVLSSKKRPRGELDWAQLDVGFLDACKMIIHHLCRPWTNKRREPELALTALWMVEVPTLGRFLGFFFFSRGGGGVSLGAGERVRGAKRWSLLPVGS